ncbi:phage distal tail protein domain-containing protein, partial [Pseudomonas sp. TAA207]|uniref:phage distal tail protein domain-containing protein n=1 Tax=Pseudomonas sp. TAA207 TaxID=1729582 RepID=UPI000A51D26A
MVRQYKIHTNLDGTDDKIWDVTNGKVRFYQPSNLGLQSTNNIWQSNGIGVMGTRSITQPQIEFKLETFGESLEENYQLMKDFVNDVLSKKFVTLEYQTEIFQVYADLALADVTKTEGYGKNGAFSEKITFDIITKWYTYENLTFDKIQNGKVIAGKSKIYGGYKGSETALQNYNRLKSSPSLNLPNLNLLDGTKDFSGDW